MNLPMFSYGLIHLISHFVVIGLISSNVYASVSSQAAENSSDICPNNCKHGARGHELGGFDEFLCRICEKSAAMSFNSQLRFKRDNRADDDSLHAMFRRLIQKKKRHSSAKKSKLSKRKKGRHSSKRARGRGKRNGMGVAAVGNARAMSSDGNVQLRAMGHKGPSADSSGGGEAYADDGHTSVISKKGKKRVDSETTGKSKNRKKKGHAHGSAASSSSHHHSGNDEGTMDSEQFAKNIDKQNKNLLKSIMEDAKHGKGGAVFASSGGKNGAFASVGNDEADEGGMKDGDDDDEGVFNPFKMLGMKDPRDYLKE